MLRSGLVSLNIHEPLTFEGTEICLHPDLFEKKITDSSSFAGSARLSVAGGSKDSRIPLIPSASSEDIKYTSAAGSMTSQKHLQVGDMIEIRVWDPLPRTETKSNVSSVIRWGKPSTPISSQSSTSGSAKLERSSSSPETKQVFDEALTSLERTRSVSSSTNSMQYSESAGASPTAHGRSGDGVTDEGTSMSKDTLTVSSEDRTLSVHNNEAISTPQPSPNSNSSSKSTSDDAVPPTKTVITSASVELPPVFPRNRTSTTEGGTVPLPPKPPQQGQRRTPPPTDLVGSNKGRPIHNASSLPRTRHFRDISDMTIDTVCDKATVLDSSNQWTDLQQVPLTNSTASEEDEDYWTHLYSTHSMRLSFIMLVTEKSLTSLKGTARTQVSILRPVAELYQLSTLEMITVHKIEQEDQEAALQLASADFVAVTIKDQFISRGDMHFFQSSLVGSWVYEGQRLHNASRGIQAHAREIRHQDQHAASGIITEQTHITFRSRSARIIWLVQLSSEMWDYASPFERDNDESLCETYFDKWISFIHRLFVQWKELEVTHSLTIIFFSRTFIGAGAPSLSHTPGTSSSQQRDVHGRRFEDHFRSIIENVTNTDWDSLVVHIKEAFLRYPSEVGWNRLSCDDARRPSSSSQGNVLEAFNVALNLLQFHYLDRDLNRTGNSLVLVSAGNGVFEVDKGLAGITYQRMMDHGIGTDVLSLALPPLHIAPFFFYVSDYDSVETEGVDAASTYFEVPHWMHLSFVSYESDTTVNRYAEPSLEMRNTAVHVTNIDGRPVAAHGFLLPEVRNAVVNGSGHSQRQTSFSVQGNEAASPSSKKARQLTQDRQLIAGRDFRDILEACRPRHSGKLPSALEALLGIYEQPPYGEVEKCCVAEDPQRKYNEGFNPQEWGSLDFEAKHSGRVSVSLGGSPRHGPVSPPRVDELERVDIGGTASQASSYSSQHSSLALGVSYDRPFLSHRASPALTGIQIQRSPSLELRAVDEDDSEGALSDSSTATSGLDLSRGSSVESGNVSRQRRRGEDKNLALRRLMQEYDSKSLSQPSSPHRSPQLETNRSRHGEVSSNNVVMTTIPGIGVDSSMSKQRRSQVQQGASGLGAALNQYRATGAIDGDGSIPSFSRVSSTSRLTGMNQTRLQLAEMGSRGISPLLLPPVALSTSENADMLHGAGAGVSSYRIAIEQRLVHPAEILRQTGLDSSNMPGAKAITPSGLSRSPPSIVGAGSKTNNTELRSLSERRQRDARQRSRPSRSRPSRSRRKKAFNPFRQQDEDEVLAKKSHNRRRWSHVFPLGEVEFKRHAGPNWKSLSAPAILPLSVDYFPSQQEVDHNYTFSIYNVTLSEFENTAYSTNKDLLMEMVRQRLTQDYQLVPPSHVNASNFRRETLRDGLANRGRSSSITDEADEGSETIRQFLSMGHRLQVLTYDPSGDVIEVTRYHAKSTQKKSDANTFSYRYSCFCPETKQYTKVSQTFTKYEVPYNWNKVDRIICGDEDREMREGMRFKRVMFALLPEHFDDSAKEQEHIAKFQRLLEYLNKLRDKEGSTVPLNIKIVSSMDRKRDPSAPVQSIPGISGKSMQRFYVQLRKGKRDPLEWMEVVVDSTFDTSWSYRLIFNWLVPSASKVEAQVQLLHRRCAQYGLQLVPFPQVSVSESPYLNPFRAPAVFTVFDKEKVALLEQELLMLDFVHDGVFYTDARVLKECIDGGENLDFGKRRSLLTPGQQFVHRSGTFFVRLLKDSNMKVVVLAFGNYLCISKDNKLAAIAQKAFRDVSDCIGSTESKLSTTERELSPSTPEITETAKDEEPPTAMKTESAPSKIEAETADTS